jgi:hypothetical protein
MLQTSYVSPAPPEIVLDAATREFLMSGCALIVATVGPGGEPYATRGWGLDVSPAGGVARVLLAATDDVTLTNLTRDGRIAVTGADVRTLRSVQVKGTATETAPATAPEEERAQRFIDEFFTGVGETDGTPRELMQRLVPPGYVVVHFTIHEAYDQTPGPRAGSHFDRSTP